MNTVVSCTLLILPGYNHGEKYRKKYELTDDQWRYVTGSRLVLPLLAGYVRYPDGHEEPAFIGVSFTPRERTVIESLEYALEFFRNPVIEKGSRAPRTMLISRIAEPQKVKFFTVALAEEIALGFVKAMQQKLTAPPPGNFVVSRSLLDVMFGDDPQEMLRAIGLESKDDEIEDDEEWEEGEWFGDDWENEGWEEESQEWKAEGEEEGQEWETEEPESEEGAGQIDEGALEEIEKPGPPPAPAVPSAASKVEAGGEERSDEWVREIASLYHPSAQVRAWYTIPDKREDEEADINYKNLVKFLPSPAHALLSTLVSIATILSPVFSLLMFIIVGGRAGLRMVLGALFLHGIYVLYQWKVPRDWWILYLLFGTLGLFFFFLGVLKLYKRYRLKLDLSGMAKNISRAAQAQLKSSAAGRVQAAAAAVPMATAPGPSVDIKGAVSDLLFFLSPALFVWPPLIPVGVAFVLALWHAERKLFPIWNIFGVAHLVSVFAFRSSDLRWEVVALLTLARLLAFQCSRSELDITFEQLRAAPKAVVGFLRLLSQRPIDALKYLWNGKGAIKEKVRFAAQPVPEPVANLLRRLPREAKAEILSYLSPEQLEAWKEVAGTAGTVLPVFARAEEGGRFYTETYRIEIARPIAGTGIHPEAENRMVSALSQALARELKVVMRDGKIEIPRLCQTSPQVNPQCLISAPPPVIIRGKEGHPEGVVIPMGVSYIYYIDSSGRHRHYCTGVIFGGKWAGHMMIAAPSGSGKSVLLRAIMNGISVAAESYPIRILYAEAKQELAGFPERSDPFLSPLVFLNSGSVGIRWLAAVLSILDHRQAFANALANHLMMKVSPERLFISRYGGFPFVVVVLDEFWSLRTHCDTMKSLQCVTDSGQKLTVSATQAFSSAISRILTTARSLGIAFVLTTQSTRHEVLLPSIRDNATGVLGKLDKGNEQLATNALGKGDLAAMREITFQATGSTQTSVTALYGFAMSSPRGATVAWIRDGQFIESGNATLFPNQPPAWDLFCPFYYPDLRGSSSVFSIDTERLRQDIIELARQGKIANHSPEYWMKAMGISPFEDVQELMDFGEQGLRQLLLASVAEIQQKSEDSQ